MLAAAWILQASPSLACSVCQPGDPLFSSEGASAGRVGDVWLYLETRQLWKKSGALPHEDEEEEEHEEEGHGNDKEENYTREAELYASWTPIDRWTFTASLPFRWLSIEEQPAEGSSHTLHNSGLGDLSLFVSTVLWRNRSTLPSTWIEGRAMLKAPTGKDEERVDGELDPHAQLGTGSWDWGLGLAAGHRFERTSVYGSVFYRVNNEGGLDYEYGDAFLMNAAITSDALHLGLPGASGGLRTGAELNFRYAGKDEFDGATYRDSGGTIFYLTPFTELRLGGASSERAPWLRLAVRIPLGNGGLHGFQREGYILNAGLRFAF